MSKSKTFGSRKPSYSNTLGDFMSKELKEKINDAVKKKDSSKKNNKDSVRDK